jgi:hypothetical protein
VVVRLPFLGTCPLLLALGTSEDVPHLRLGGLTTTPLKVAPRHAEAGEQVPRLGAESVAVALRRGVPKRTEGQRACSTRSLFRVRVVADSHAIFWHLQGSARLSAAAASALTEAETTGGVVISIATLIDLWYVTQTTRKLTDANLTELRDPLAQATPR